MKVPPHENVEQRQEVAELTEPRREAHAVIAEAAHELRLPIANLKLLIETLLDGAMEEREVSKRMLKRAYQEIERLRTLVDDMLALEQIQERKHDLHCSWVSLRGRASYAVEAVAKQASAKSVKVINDVAADCRIWANQEQLEQVLLNLVENAVKFTPSGGKVWIRSGSAPGSFEVEDTGIGMAVQEIPKIFSRFYRVDKSSSRGGTGLGLSIVKQVLDLHGAKITVNSTEGKGSCFSLEFPGPGGLSIRSRAEG